MPWVEARRSPSYTNETEFTKIWLDGDEYEDYLDEINEHCPVCGKRLDEYESGICAKCKAKYTTFDWADAYQKSDPTATREIEIPALWADLLDESVILTVLEKEFYKTAELYKMYLPDRLQKVVEEFCLEDESYYYDWLKKQDGFEGD